MPNIPITGLNTRVPGGDAPVTMLTHDDPEVLAEIRDGKMVGPKTFVIFDGVLLTSLTRMTTKIVQGKNGPERRLSIEGLGPHLVAKAGRAVLDDPDRHTVRYMHQSAVDGTDVHVQVLIHQADESRLRCGFKAKVVEVDDASPWRTLMVGEPAAFESWT